MSHVRQSPSESLDFDAVLLQRVADLPRRQAEQARSLGWQAVIVLGHPDYYPRFGFDAELAHKLAAPFSGDAFMALELTPDALRGTGGRIVYPPAFGQPT